MKKNDNHLIYVIVPCYNEAEVLRQTILPLIEQQYKVVVVDDGSIDNSWESVQDLPVFYLKHLTNLGQGAALQTGMDFVLKEGGKIAVHFDADGQHDAKNISDLVQPILDNEYDIVIGSRFLEHGEAIGLPFIRKIILQLGRIFNKIFTGFWFSDAHNGFRALGIEALKKIDLKENRMAYATEILQQIRKENLSIKEVPVSITYTKYSISKGQNNLNAINIFIDMTIRKLL